MRRLSLLALMILFLNACAPSQTAQPQAATPAEQTVASATTSPAGEPELAEVQELTVGISRNLVNGEQDWIYAHASLQVWEPLIRYDDELRPYPGLAENWTLSPDGLTWTFDLRQDVNFSDGEPFNAEAAVAAIERFRVVSGRPSIFLGGINFPEIYGNPTAIEVVDEFTFRIVYDTPRPLLPYSIANHYSAMLSPKVFAENGDIVGLPIGTGPYKLVDWRRDQYAVLERNENYWSEKPTLTKITLRIYPDANSRLSALKSGEVDALVELGAVLSAQARDLRNDPEFVVSDHVSACSSQISFNGTQPPFDDVRLRQAVSLAVDREGLVRDLLYGYATPAQSILISPNKLWLNQEPEAQLRYDPEEA
ncbi:MAG: ABC transporter substrate-binding protein [Caldilineaceae bacterium]|nr:ABC transporter substrate-binding protein [Caldilineaceae bacterium]